MATSKTARASTRAAAGAAGAYQIAAETSRIIPLDGGRHAYLLTNDGRTLRRRCGTTAFNEVLAEMHASAGAKIDAELAQLAETYPDHGWDRTAAAFREHLATAASGDSD